MKPAFSTVACPDWTLDQVARGAEEWGFLGVELRTFGSGSTQFACDPALTAPEKTRSLFDRAGVEIACLGTSVRFDEPGGSPLAYIVGDKDRSTREVKDAIQLACELECPFVRVFGFELEGNESRRRAMQRVVERLRLALAAARHTQVRLVIENGGTFRTATALAELLDQVDNPALGAAYSFATASSADENPAHGVNVLGDRLLMAKVADYHAGVPCALGQGDVPNRQGVEALAQSGFAGWIVYEYPRAWVGGATAAPEGVLTQSAKALYSWIGRREINRPSRASVRA